MIEKVMYLKLVKGWCVIYKYTTSLNEYYKLLHNFQCKQGILRFEKKTQIHRFSIYDIDTFYRECSAMGIEVVSTKLLQLYNSILQKRLSSKSPELSLSLWTDNPTKQLYDYQKLAIGRALAIRNLIIADTLGLGKTNQCIGTICESITQNDTKKHIVVVPSKLRVQWHAEFLQFTKLTKEDVLIFDDPRVSITKKKAGGMELKAYKEKVRRDSIYDAKILLISYNMIKKYNRHLKKQKYDTIILDEATKIKNRTETTKQVKELCAAMSKKSIKLFVTGTPIENKLEDLYNVFTIIDKRIFGWAGEFKFNYTHTDLQGKVLEYKNIPKFKEKIKSFYVRRTSDLVWKDRPKLNEKYEICEMEGKQKQLYKDARKGVLADLLDLEKQTQINNASLAPLMQILLSVTGTCKAILPEYEGKDHSCKVKVLIEMINDFDKHDKMIIFSRYANKVNPYIRRDLEQQTKLKVLEATGKTKNPTEVIEEFGSSQSVLLASDSVSYGANIQCANYLVNFDLPWNPAVFSQRVGRAYRRGQERNVNVVNLLAANTFDMEVYEKLYKKQNLFNMIFKSDLSSFKVENSVDQLKEMLYEHTKQR